MYDRDCCKKGGALSIAFSVFCLEKERLSISKYRINIVLLATKKLQGYAALLHWYFHVHCGLKRPKKELQSTIDDHSPYLDVVFEGLETKNFSTQD